MKSCVVKITTTIDGRENSVTKQGEMHLDALSATLIYKEENAVVTLTLTNAVLNIVREGDYSLRLRLEENKLCEGEIGIGGANGKVSVQTKKLAYSLTKTSWLLLAQYALLAGGEPQETTIRIQAKFGDIGDNYVN